MQRARSGEQRKIVRHQPRNQENRAQPPRQLIAGIQEPQVCGKTQQVNYYRRYKIDVIHASGFKRFPQQPRGWTCCMLSCCNRMLSLFSIVHSYLAQHFRHTRLFSNQQVIKGFAILELHITYGLSLIHI